MMIYNGGGPAILVSGLGAVAVLRPQTWWTFVYALIFSSEWKKSPDRGLLERVFK